LIRRQSHAERERAIVGSAVGKQGIPSDWIDGLWEWPRSVAWLEALAVLLASLGSTDKLAAPNLPWLGVSGRNALFASLVLLHGFRRLLPPY
jgi:hypothetical protein